MITVDIGARVELYRKRLGNKLQLAIISGCRAGLDSCGTGV